MGFFTQAITQGPGGQMYTDGSGQTPYNPHITQQMPKMEQHIARPINDNMRMDIQDRRARPPQLVNQGGINYGGPATGPTYSSNPFRKQGFINQGGIGSFPNPFGGFMGGGRGNFMRPQPPMYGGGFGGFGMQPPMFGGGMGYGMPPMFGGGGMYGGGGGGMYGGGFGMQPPMFGGGYGGGFGSPFGQSFYGGIGGMFPGMGGGYGMQRPSMYGGGGFGGGFRQQPPSYGGIGGGFGQPMPVRPQPMPIGGLRPPKTPMPMPIDGPKPVFNRGPGSLRRNEIDIARSPKQYLNLKPRPAPMMQTQGPESLNRYNSYKGMPFENFEAVAF